MNLKELMETNPQDLAVLQHKELKAHVLNILSEVADAIKNDQFHIIDDMTEESPSGDGYGRDNSYIDFGYGDRSMDITEITATLAELYYTTHPRPTKGMKTKKE